MKRKKLWQEGNSNSKTNGAISHFFDLIIDGGVLFLIDISIVS